MNKTIIVKIETLEWGTIRTIRVGLNYTIVFHPEHWDKMINFIADEKVMDKLTFTDETGNSWLIVWGINKGNVDVEFYYNKNTDPCYSTPACKISLKEFLEIFNG